MQPKWIDSGEALTLLGVRPQTLYANVSRGKIEAKPAGDGSRAKLYRKTDVLRLVARGRGARSESQVASEALNWGEGVLPTQIAAIKRGTLFYRGENAVMLSESHTSEGVASLLWNHDEPIAFPLGVSSQSPGRRAAFISLGDRAGSDLPTFARSKQSLLGEAQDLIGLLGTALTGACGPGPLHEALATHWNLEAREVLRKALVLLADHELNASTFAVRVAASTGSSLAACLLAGLSTLAGPLHGGASRAVASLVRNSGAKPKQVIAEMISEGRTIPGFGHPLYPDGDPRAEAIIAAFELPEAYSEIISVAKNLTGQSPTVDFALSAIAAQFDLPEDAPFSIFALGRSIGWSAHAVEQSQSQRILRPRAMYVGPKV